MSEEPVGAAFAAATPADGDGAGVTGARSTVWALASRARGVVGVECSAFDASVTLSGPPAERTTTTEGSSGMMTGSGGSVAGSKSGGSIGQSRRLPNTCTQRVPCVVSTAAIPVAAQPSVRMASSWGRDIFQMTNAP